MTTQTTFLDGVQVLVPKLIPDVVHYLCTGRALQPLFMRVAGYRTRVEAQHGQTPRFSLEPMPVVEKQTSASGAVRRRKHKRK